MKKSHKIALTSVIAIAIILIIVLNIFNNGKPAPVTATNVNVTPATKKTLSINVTTFGNLVSIKQVNISTTDDGRVTAMFQNGNGDGQTVTKGTTLVQVDPELAQAAVQLSEANLKLSEDTLARYKQLLKDGATTQAQVEKLVADVEAKKAQLNNDKIALNRLTLQAPFDGQLQNFSANPGDYVTAGQTLVTLINKEKLDVSYSINENYLQDVHVGETVFVNVESADKKTYKGTVTKISPSIDSSTGTFQVQAELDNKNGDLSPGAFSEITQPISSQKDSVVIPEEAIVTSLAGHFVYVVKNNTAKEVQVCEGIHKGGLVQILPASKAKNCGQIKLGDLVVIEGQQKIKSGSNVNASIVKPPKAETKPQANNKNVNKKQTVAKG